DHVVRSTLDVEVALLVAITAVLHVKPPALPPHGDLAGPRRRQLMPALVDDGDVDAGGGLAERAGLDPIAVEARVVHDEDADLRRAVHAARCEREGARDPG